MKLIFNWSITNSIKVVARITSKEGFDLLLISSIIDPENGYRLNPEHLSYRLKGGCMIMYANITVDVGAVTW